MFVYRDDYYEDSEGHLYTKEYFNNSKMLDTMRKLSEEEKYDVKGWIRCNYSQLFHEDDALILCNNIMHYYENLQLENGDDSVDEVFQFYIIDDDCAQRLKRHTDEIIYYWEDLDVYVLGVTHYGTNWDFVGAEYLM